MLCKRGLTQQATFFDIGSDSNWLGDTAAHRAFIEEVGRELGVKEVRYTTRNTFKP